MKIIFRSNPWKTGSKNQNKIYSNHEQEGEVEQLVMPLLKEEQPVENTSPILNE